MSEPGHVPAPGHGAEHVTTARCGERGGEHSQPEQRDLIVRCSQHSLDRNGQYFYFDNIWKGHAVGGSEAVLGTNVYDSDMFDIVSHWNWTPILVQYYIDIYT